MATKKQEKKLIKVDIPNLYIDTDIFEGDLQKIVENVKNLPDKLKEHIELYHLTDYDLNLVEIYKLETSYNWEGDTEINLRGYRWETDAELKEQIKKQKEADKKRKETILLKNKNKEIEDRKLYEELKKRFEDVQNKEQTPDQD